MRKRLMLVGIGAVIAVWLGASAGASAATQVGDPCAANDVAPYEETVTFFQFVTPQSPFPAAVPSPGVITSWSMNIGSATPAFSDPLTFKVVRPNLTAMTAQVVGEDSETVHAGSNTFATRIPVQAGDLIGMTNDGKTLVYCNEPSIGSAIGAVQGAPTVGSTVPYIERHEEAARIPIFATVEPDADGDGYGDETQDKCPTDASTHEACPVKATPPPPAAPITLSASAAAKKTFLTVSLTTTAQASVTVTGTVKIGKGKPVKLSGNTQTVALGALAKFTVLFPAKLKAALKQLPSNKKLTISLSASAPGATTKTLTVKVPGQKRPKRGGGHEQHHLM
jgi:hypothetical protein